MTQQLTLPTRSPTPAQDPRWAHQPRARAAIESAYRDGKRAIAVIIPTGGGKTHLFSSIARGGVTKGFRWGIWVHRDELIGQTVDGFRELGLNPGVVSAGYPRTDSLLQVLSVQTAIARGDLPPFDGVVFDECVTGDTIVGGKPASLVRPGDVVETAYGPAPVSYVWDREAPAELISVRTEGGREIVCTPSHPIWTLRGFVRAQDIRSGDHVLTREPVDAAFLRLVRCDVCRYSRELLESAKNVRAARGMPLVPEGEVSPHRIRDNGAHEQGACQCSHEGEQPDAHRLGTRIDVGYAAQDRAQTACARRERSPIDQASGDVAASVGGRVGAGTHCPNRGANEGTPVQLQDRHREPVTPNRCRGGRGLPLCHREARAGQAQDGLAAVDGLDRVSSVERRSSCELGISRVYDFEVDGAHCYFANGILSHNCHHFTGAEKWSGIPAHYRERKTLVLGFTATPERGDGAAIGNAFDHMIVVCQPQELIDAGVLVRARVIHPFRQSKALAMHPLEFHTKYARDRRFIVFAATVRHGKDLAHEFTAAGFPCACVEGSMKADERAAAIAAFRRGELQGLTNYMVLTEGFNVPEVSEIITCRAFQSPGMMMQCNGRGMRAAPGKVDLIIGDLRGWSLDPNIGMPEDDREFSLQGKAIRTADGAQPTRQCPQCFAIFRSAEFEDRTCPACGWITRGRRNPAIRRQIMSEHAASESGEDRVKYLSRCVNSCLLDGHELGKARFLYVAKYTAPEMLRRKVRAAYKWPNKAALEASGHDAAKEVLREISMFNTVRRTQLKPVITGIPGADNKSRPYVDTKTLAQLIRLALIQGTATQEISGRAITVEMVDQAARKTGT